MSEKNWVRSAACPKCNHVGEVREIIYGLPMPDFDLSEYEIGGCIVSSSMPEVACRACGWAGKLDRLIQPTQ